MGIPISGRPKTGSEGITDKSLNGSPSGPEDAFMRKYIAGDARSPDPGAWAVLISASSFPEVHVAAEAALSEKGYAVRPLFRASLLQDGDSTPAILRF
jgi:hypothetical protein